MSYYPFRVFDNVKEYYKNYLLTTFKFEDSMLQQQLEEKIESRTLFKGPFMEISRSFYKGKCIRDLIDEGVLSDLLLKQSIDSLPINRSLYHHQEKAIKQITVKKRNAVITTGTGSGKTESFLIPIINELLNEIENKTLSPGVRAVLIYPMNALASDQMERIRELLEAYPEITFGSYTGNTEYQEDEALNLYRKIYDNKKPLENELISREKMKESPPNILVTNYSMLEYLMLRPEDTVFFDGKYSNNWKYIILDEAHMYTGTKGIEISYLIRRLKNRVSNANNNIKFILTSASLGRGEEDNAKIAQFANLLTGNDFDVEDVIHARYAKNSDIEPLYTVSNDLILELSKKKSIDQSLKEKVREYIITDFNDLKYDEVLYQLFSKDKRVYHLLNYEKIIDAYKYYEDFLIEQMTLEEFKSFIKVISEAHHHKKLILIKYHYFVRTFEGAFISLYPDKQLYLNRLKEKNIEGKKVKVFEIGVCKNCNSLFIIGDISTEGHLVQSHNNKGIEIYSKNYFSLIKKDEISYFREIAKIYEMCPVCGRIKLHNNTYKQSCDCNINQVIYLMKNRVGDDSRIHKCLKCEKVSTKTNIVRKFLLGREAATTVLLDKLFNEIKGEQRVIKHEEPFGYREEKINKKPILSFSDSRQSAAYFTSYFSETYEKFVSKKLMLKALKGFGNTTVTFDSWYKEYFNLLREYDNNLSKEDAMIDMVGEFINNDGRNSLEKLGFFYYYYNFNFNENNPLTKEFSISAENLNVLLNIILLKLKNKGVIYDYKKIISKKGWDEFTFTYKTRYIEKWKSNNYNVGFLTDIKYMNSLTDYIMKVFQFDRSKTQELLIKFFESLEFLSKQEYNLVEYSKEGLKINPQNFNVHSIFDSDFQVYVCEKCKDITGFNIDNHCLNYRCDGNLIPINPKNYFEKNHYWNSFNVSNIEKLKISEHTAQLSNKHAKEKQREFIEGKINVLSCTTTFEVGVDVGNLETVLLRNVPPTPANYIQRAGRAGRRADNVALILTYCSLKSHDFNFFNNPIKMIDGKIKPPVFDLENYKILQRHMNAEAFSFFWSKYPEFFTSISKFINNNGYDQLKNVLKNKPEELLNRINNIVPNHINLPPELSGWQWSNELISDEGLLIKIIDETKFDLEDLEKAKQNWIEKEVFYKVQMIKNTMRNIGSHHPIGYFAKNNILPKYGFPIDNVNLMTNNPKIELNRDLKLALTEYSPGSEIIADGMIYTSRYIKNVQGKELESFEYKICPECGSVQRKRTNTSSDIDYCKNCGSKAGLSQRDRGTYKVPQFGFITDFNPKDAGTKKPTRTYYTRKFYIGNNEEYQKKENVKIGNNLVQLLSSNDDKMAIIGKGEGNGFYYCPFCGYSEVVKGFEPRIKKEHKKYTGYECKNNQLNKIDLGYEFKTDIVVIDLPNLKEETESAQKSILYGVLDGLSDTLEVERSDIDGCYFKKANKTYMVLYDSVPGGAGHVKRIFEKNVFAEILENTLLKISSCTCGIETSCYGCLRNYQNQRDHDELKRSEVINYIQKILSI